MRWEIRPFGGLLVEAQAALEIDRQIWNQCPYSAEELLALFSRPEHRAWLAWVGSQPAGLVSCFSWRGPESLVWEIDVLLTRPEYRGHGIGTALIRAAVDHFVHIWTSANGLAVIRGVVATGNAASSRAFVKAGFAPGPEHELLVYSIEGLSPRPLDLTAGGQPLTVIWELTPPHYTGSLPATDGQWLQIRRPIDNDRVTAAAWCVPVHTFLYSGLWLEAIKYARNDLSALGVLAHAAVERGKRETLDAVGALACLDRPASLLLRGEGFKLQDRYRLFQRRRGAESRGG